MLIEYGFVEKVLSDIQSKQEFSNSKLEVSLVRGASFRDDEALHAQPSPRVGDVTDNGVRLVSRACVVRVGGAFRVQVG